MNAPPFLLAVLVWAAQAVLAVLVTGVAGLGAVFAGLVCLAVTSRLAAWPATSALMAGLSFAGGLAPGCASLLGLAFISAAVPTRNMLALSLLLGLLGFFSGGAGGPDPMLRLFLGWGLTENQANALTFAARKAVHFGFYGLVAVAWRSSGAGWGASFTATAALALFDEGRQALSPGRSGQLLDVVIDLAGAAAALLWLGRRKIFFQP